MRHFDEIRQMNVFQLRRFIRENRKVNVIVMSGRYDDDQRLLASQVLYAKNRLKLMT